ncbi:MAG TPA: Hpt domain-containing protein [Bacteroidales bacterium]|nr:Hpt domain-containing protein [Bacteroidales bacterium]
MLRTLSGNDETFIIDMLQTFKKTNPPIVARMEEYAAQKKYEPLGREAHKMIPGVSFLGARDLEKVLVTIEENAKTGSDPENMPVLVSEVKRQVNELIGCFEKDFNL